MAPSLRRPQHHPALLSPACGWAQSPRGTQPGPWQVEETLRDQERGRRVEGSWRAVRPRASRLLSRHPDHHASLH